MLINDVELVIGDSHELGRCHASTDRNAALFKTFHHQQQQQQRHLVITKMSLHWK